LKASAHINSTVWKAWLAALLWLGLIAVESTNTLSAENTGHILYPLLHFLLGLDPVRFLTWHFVLRKTGHVLGYAVLSLLLFRAWKASIVVSGSPRWSIVWARIAFAMATLVASLDEWHQTFLPSRTGTIWDIVLDSTAALVAQILLFWWIRRTGKHTPQAQASGAAGTGYEHSPRRTTTPMTD
jgi:VanZ family protein